LPRDPSGLACRLEIKKTARRALADVPLILSTGFRKLNWVPGK
jgi:hypothetical protein